MLNGIGFHHAGLDLSDRKFVEHLFLNNNLPVLISTSTLAMGVNFPAHLVVVKSTSQFVSGCCKEYSETQVLQMIGRAGRPQFDSSATAVIMTKQSLKPKYDSLMNGTEMIESSLHKHIAEHLNTEISLGAITDVSVAIKWIKSTFLYIRLLKNPRYYGMITDKNEDNIEKKLQDLCLQELNALSKYKLICMEDCFDLKPTDAGHLMTKYYISFETMKQFASFRGNESLLELLTLVSECKELEDIQLRVNEKKILNEFNKSKYNPIIRFPFQSKIKNKAMKINCLAQAAFSCLPVTDTALNQDVTKILKAGLRVSQCLSDYLTIEMKGFNILLNALILSKCFKVHLWENSKYVSRQLGKIGVSSSNILVNAGITSFQNIMHTNPRELELLLSRNPPFGSNLVDAVSHLPFYTIETKQVHYDHGVAYLCITVHLTNFQKLRVKRTAPENHTFTLIIGDADNNIVFYQQIIDVQLLETGRWIKKLEIIKASQGEDINIHLLSDHYVGLDVHCLFRPYYSGGKHTLADNNAEKIIKQPVLSRNISEKINKSNNEETKNLASKENWRSCHHRCLDKMSCFHNCCKSGISVKDAAKQSKISQFFQQMHERSCAMPPKIIKLTSPGEFDHSEGLSQLAKVFSYTPKSNYAYSTQCTSSSTATAHNPIQHESSEVKVNTKGILKHQENNFSVPKDQNIVQADVSLNKAKSEESNLSLLQLDCSLDIPSPTSVTVGNPAINAPSYSNVTDYATSSDKLCFDLDSGNFWSEPMDADVASEQQIGMHSDFNQETNKYHKSLGRKNRPAIISSLNSSPNRVLSENMLSMVQNRPKFEDRTAAENLYNSLFDGL